MCADSTHTAAALFKVKAGRAQAPLNLIPQRLALSSFPALVLRGISACNPGQKFVSLGCDALCTSTRASSPFHLQGAYKGISGTAGETWWLSAAAVPSVGNPDRFCSRCADFHRDGNFGGNVQAVTTKRCIHCTAVVV